ncbi:MAG TPA: PIN domain-containing protein [Candidatus Tectomicrobia bacterium]|jgi:predicted nucleic acid-binding protein
MRVILDTNVLVAALRSDMGASYAIVSQLPSARFQMALTVPLYLQYQDVLTRPEHMTGASTPDDMLNFLRYLCSIAHRQRVFFLWRPWLTDPKDDMVLEAAVASQSRYIITHNLRDFTRSEIEEYFGIVPLRPQAFLHRLRSQAL